MRKRATACQDRRSRSHLESAVTPPAPRAHASAPRPGRAAAGGRFGGTALLLATVPAGDGGPAAALGWEDTTLLGRLLAQLADLGIREADLITREAWVPQLEACAAGHGLRVRLHGSADAAGDLRGLPGPPPGRR